MLWLVTPNTARKRQFSQDEVSSGKVLKSSRQGGKVSEEENQVGERKEEESRQEIVISVREPVMRWADLKTLPTSYFEGLRIWIFPKGSHPNTLYNHSVCTDQRSNLGTAEWETKC
jgi:hypothetical protein